MRAGERDHPERVAAFLPLILENATASRERETGCRQFDDCRDPPRRRRRGLQNQASERLGGADFGRIRAPDARHPES